MHVLTNAEKLIPLRDAASLAESRRLAGMRMVTGTTSPSTRYERISVSPASCSIKSEYVIASHAFKPQYKCINYTPAWEQRKFGELYRPVSEKNDLSFGRDKAISVANMYFNPAVYVTEDSYLATYNVMRLGDIAFEGNRSKRFAHGRFVENTIGDGIVSHVFKVFRHVGDNYDLSYWKHAINNEKLMKDVLTRSTKASTMMHELVTADFLEELTLVPSLNEQRAIGAAIDSIDNLITLHQRKYDGCTLSPIFFRKVHTMQENITSESLFCDYYAQWVRTYKEGAIRDVTMGKYRLTQSWLSKLIPELRLADMDRTAYQQLINGYAQHHERQTTMDFHHQIKGAILDAVDEGLIPRDPTRKVIIKGKQPRIKKMKYLNQFELHAMLADLDLGDEASWDWLILLIAKTGLRFSEALGLTPDDFDFAHQTLSVNKTWDYKNGGGFVPTKNESSVRKVQLDWQLIMQMSGLLKDLPHDKPIFVHGKVYNSTANDVLAKHCRNVDVPVISVHGLRHTHASLLLFAGVSIASVSRRLGHASMTTTQETYLHVIRELENKDVDIVMRALSTLI